MAKIVALVAGEASGDQLGASLIRSLARTHPDMQFVGIGGPQMKSAGMDCWWDSEELAVMGLTEVLSHLPRLLKLRRNLYQRLLQASPDIFIGIDAPDFNLGLETKLKKAGIATVHYVSPTIWAWREKRVKKIAKAVHHVLCLFPFEPAFYANHGVKASFVGHPMADQLEASQDTGPARAALGLNADKPLIALLPGSRGGEVSRLAQPMLEAANILQAQHPDMEFAVPMANAKVGDIFRQVLDNLPKVNCTLIEGQAHQVMAAADIVVTASGTATLETLLVNRPMVVVYRLAASTYRIATGLKLVRSRFVSLPNILADELLVPELIQHEASGENIAREVNLWLEQPQRRQTLTIKFDHIHQQLQQDASIKAAQVVTGLLKDDPTG